MREQGANAYDFSHDKIREAAYSDVSLVRRASAASPGRAGAGHGGDLDAVSGQIAMHYESAGLLESTGVSPTSGRGGTTDLCPYRGDPSS